MLFHLTTTGILDSIKDGCVLITDHLEAGAQMSTDGSHSVGLIV